VLRFNQKNLLEDSREDMLNINSSIINESDLIVIYGMSIGETDKLLWNIVGEVSVNKNIPMIIYHYTNDIDKAIIREQKRLIRALIGDFISKSGVAEEKKTILRDNLHIILGTADGVFKLQKG
jgi:tryptophan synthase subunit beta